MWIFSNIISQKAFYRICNFSKVHAQKSLSSLDNKLEEELNSDGTSVDRRIVERAMEIRWSIISNSVSQLSSLLAENLRMIIEPTIASRLQGDYRTGKRLNIRRLISYVASDYRKDRIWMRRTKKVKRNYQICIAVDDSASVKDNAMSTVTIAFAFILHLYFHIPDHLSQFMPHWEGINAAGNWPSDDLQIRQHSKSTQRLFQHTEQWVRRSSDERTDVCTGANEFGRLSFPLAKIYNS